MSMGQGADYLKYHHGQHGGEAPYPMSVEQAMALPGDMRGSAMMNGPDGAFREIAGMKDQAGGRRRKTGKKGKKSRKHRKSHHKSQRKQRRTRGGELEYAPVSSPTMLLSPQGYAQAGLNPSYITGGVEAEQALAREAIY
jgi:hypothetical protein